MMRRGSVDWTVGKLLAIVLAVVLLVIVLFGWSSAVKPLVERAGGKIDEVLILLHMRNDGGGDVECIEKDVTIEGVGEGRATYCREYCEIEMDEVVYFGSNRNIKIFRYEGGEISYKNYEEGNWILGTSLIFERGVDFERNVQGVYNILEKIYEEIFLKEGVTDESLVRDTMGPLFLYFNRYDENGNKWIEYRYMIDSDYVMGEAYIERKINDDWVRKTWDGDDKIALVNDLYVNKGSFNEVAKWSGSEIDGSNLGEKIPSDFDGRSMYERDNDELIVFMAWLNFLERSVSREAKEQLAGLVGGENFNFEKEIEIKSDIFWGKGVIFFEDSEDVYGVFYNLDDGELRLEKREGDEWKNYWEEVGKRYYDFSDKKWKLYEGVTLINEFLKEKRC